MRRREEDGLNEALYFVDGCVDGGEKGGVNDVLEKDGWVGRWEEGGTYQAAIHGVGGELKSLLTNIQLLAFGRVPLGLEEFWREWVGGWVGLGRGEGGGLNELL